MSYCVMLMPEAAGEGEEAGLIVFGMIGISPNIIDYDAFDIFTVRSVKFFFDGWHCNGFSWLGRFDGWQHCANSELTGNLQKMPLLHNYNLRSTFNER